METYILIALITILLAQLILYFKMKCVESAIKKMEFQRFGFPQVIRINKEEIEEMDKIIEELLEKIKERE